MGLPTFQSVITSAPKRYCFMISGVVNAAHTLDAGALILAVALAMNLLFISNPFFRLDSALSAGHDPRLEQTSAGISLRWSLLKSHPAEHEAWSCHSLQKAHK